MHKLHDIHYLNIGPITLTDDGQIKCVIMNRFGREEAVAQLYVVRKEFDANESLVSDGRFVQVRLPMPCLPSRSP